MVTINTLKIGEFSDKILVDVNTKIGERIVKLNIWKDVDFKDYTKAINLTNLLNSKNEKEYFYIYATEHLGIETFEGVWYFEFESTLTNVTEVCEDGINETKALGVVANLLPYHNCLLEKIMRVKIKDCKAVSSDQCLDCVEDIYYINSMIETLKMSIQNGLYQESTEIIKILNEICECGCNNVGNKLLINGTGFGTINNSLINF